MSEKNKVAHHKPVVFDATKSRAKRIKPRYFLIAVGLFGFVGSALLIRSFASTALPNAKNEIILQYKLPHSTAINVGEGKEYEPPTALLYGDGKLFCEDKSIEPFALASAKLSKAVLSELTNSIQTSGFKDLKSGYTIDKTGVIVNELATTILVNWTGGAQSVSYVDGPKPQAFKVIEDKVQSLCARVDSEYIPDKVKLTINNLDSKTRRTIKKAPKLWSTTLELPDTKDKKVGHTEYQNEKVEEIKNFFASSSNGYFEVNGTAFTASIEPILPTISPLNGKSRKKIKTTEEYVPIGAATSSSPGIGLSGAYFNNNSPSGPAVTTQIDNIVNFDWGTSSPATGVGSDNFRVRWTGQLSAPVSGTYKIQTQSDDGIRVWIKTSKTEKLIIDNWTDHALTTNISGGLRLKANTKYDIRIEYYDRTGGAIAKLMWVTPGTTDAVAVPQTNLYPIISTLTPPPLPPSTETKPTVTLSASPSSIAYGSSSTLTWNSTNNPTSCTGAGGNFGGAKATSGSQSTGYLTTTTTYSIICTNSIGSASASVTVTVASQTPTQELGTGLSASFYNNTLSSASVVRTDKNIDFDIGTGSPGTGINSDYFRARWNGQIQTGSSGTYQLQTISDDGVRVWLTSGGTERLIIDNWTNHGPTTNTSGAITLSANTKYSIRVEYYEYNVGSTLRLLWSTPANSAFTIIPQSSLFPVTSTLGAPPVPASFKPIVTLSASPSSVAYGSSSTLTWSTINTPTICTGSGGAFAGSKASSGAQSTGSLTANITFTLTCTNIAGTGSASTSVSVAALYPKPYPVENILFYPYDIAPISYLDLLYQDGVASSVQNFYASQTGKWFSRQPTRIVQGRQSVWFYLTCHAPGGCPNADYAVWDNLYYDRGGDGVGVQYGKSTNVYWQTQAGYDEWTCSGLGGSIGGWDVPGSKGGYAVNINSRGWGCNGNDGLLHQIAGHEAGHSFGLAHTSELDLLGHAYCPFLSCGLNYWQAIDLNINSPYFNN